MSKKNLIGKLWLKTFLTFAIVLTFCVSGEAQIKTRLTPLGNLLAGIQQRADSLNYISEQDWDVNVFVIGRNISVLNAETFLSANPFVAYQPVEEIRLMNFLQGLKREMRRGQTLEITSKRI